MRMRKFESNGNYKFTITIVDCTAKQKVEDSKSVNKADLKCDLGG